MICPWWLFYFFLNLKQVAQVYPITDVKPLSPHLSATLLTNRAEWEEIAEFIAGHFCLSVKAPVSSPPVATHSQTRSYCVEEALSASGVGSENDEINFFFSVWSSKKLLDEGNYYLCRGLLLNPARWGQHAGRFMSCVIAQTSGEKKPLSLLVWVSLLWYELSPAWFQCLWINIVSWPFF